MPPAYEVVASVVDITKDTPKTTDTFLIDTNIWFWLTYPTATHTAAHYQTTIYPNYLNQALNNGTKLLRADLSLAELSHIIETTEHEIYSNYVKQINLKEYRHNIKSERNRIVSSIDACWRQVESLTSPIPIIIKDAVTTSALNRLQTENVDGYDLFILEAMKNSGIIQVITDDGDFCTVPGIEVYTANRNVLQAAKSKGRLISRK